MARLSLPATKGNLLKIKAEHLLASEAVTFLEEKRDLLLGELLTVSYTHLTLPTNREV